MADVDINELDKKVALNTQALEKVSENQGYILKMQQTQIEHMNSVNLTLAEMKKDDEFFKKELLDIRKDYNEHKIESGPYRDKICSNEKDIKNVATNQRNQDAKHSRINIAVLLLLIGAFIRVIFIK